MVACFCTAIGFTLAYPFLPIVLREMGVAGNLDRLAGLLVGGFFALTFLTMPVWGAMADYFGPKPMLLRAGLGLGIGFTLAGLSSNLLLFSVIYLITGACNGFLAFASVMVLNNTPQQYIGRATATLYSGTLVGAAVGPALGALLAGSIGQARYLFCVGGVVVFLGGLVTLLLVRDNHRRPGGGFQLTLGQDIFNIVSVKSLRPLFLAMLAYSVTVFGSTPIITLYTLHMLAEQPDFLGWGTETWVGLANTGITVTSALSMPLWGRLVDRYNPGRMLSLAMLLALLGTAWFPFLQNPLQLVLARVLLGLLATGIQPAILSLIKDASPPGMEGRALAINTAVAMLGFGLAPLTAGWVAPFWGLEGYFALNGALLGAAFLWWALKGSNRVQ